MSKPEKTDLKDKVRGWLLEQGYPLEMRVAKILQDADFWVTQSTYYTDPETGKAREVDVVADVSGEWVDYFMFTFAIAIECKKSSKRPWVVFSATPKYFSGSLLTTGWVGSKAGTVLQKLLWANDEVRECAFHHWSGKHGYGMSEALISGKDIPYQAIMSAAKYAKDFAIKTELKVWDPPDEKVAFGCLVHPVIVLEGNLFEASLDESGQLQVEEIEEAILYHRYPFIGAEQEHTLIRVIKIDALPQFVENAREVMKLLTNSKSELKRAYDEHIIQSSNVKNSRISRIL